RAWWIVRTLPFFFFFQAEDGIRDFHVTGVQTCALPILDLVVRAARRHLAQRALEPRTALGLVPCGRRRASGLFRARRTHTASISSRIRARVRSSGSSPNAARAFSSMWRGLVVSVSTHVTSGFARMYFSENWAQLSQPISVAHPGSGRPSRRRKYTPFMNGRLMSAAIPRSARSG